MPCIYKHYDKDMNLLYESLVMKIIRELRIRYHKWRMESAFYIDRDLCRYHMNQMIRLIKGRLK